jgi:hypothetical protein
VLRLRRSPVRVLDVSVTNTNDVPLTVVLEPRARELAVLGHGTARIRFEGPEPALVEIESGNERLTIYGWEGSTISNDSPDTD